MPTRSSPISYIMTQLSLVGQNHALAPMIIPPDGGWGWVIIAVGLIASCLVDGIVCAMYIYRQPMSKDLGVSEPEVSLFQSVIQGFYFVGAVLACSCGNQFGFRTVMVLGAIVTSLSYASGYIFHHIIYYQTFVGVLAGIGSGFISVGALLPASFYFDKKRSIALGIVSCGSGLGAIVMPQVVEKYMDHYGWRNTFLFEGGLLATLIFFGLLIRPLTPVMVILEVDSSQTTLKTRGHEDSIMDYSAFRVPALPPTDAISFASMRRSGVGEVELPAQPTIAQILTDEKHIINIRVHENSDPSVLSRIQQLTQSRQGTRVLQPSASNLEANVTISREPLVQLSLPWYKCGCCRSKYATLPERPLMRTDLYYTGSLSRLHEYTGKDRELEYHMEVTRVPTYYQIVQDLTRNYSARCCHNLCSGLRFLFDYTMFKYLSFNCLALCGFGVYFAFYLPFIFCKEHLVRNGFGKEATKLVSVIGCGLVMGRLLSGVIIKTCPKFDARSVVSISNFSAGVFIVLMVQWKNLYFKGVCLFFHGFSIGFFVPLRSLIIVDYFGLPKLTSATGVVIICVGGGAFLGPPMAEVAIKVADSRDAPFYLCGIALIFSCVILFPMKILRNWELKREEKKKIQRRRES